MDPLSELVQLEVLFVDGIYRRDEKELLAAPLHEPADAAHEGFGHYDYATGAHTLAHLYRLDHPANPHKGDAWCAEFAMKLVDRWAAAFKEGQARGEEVYSLEWPPLIVCRVLDLLGDLVSAGRRAAWQAYITAWARLAGERPYGFTSPNHEGWRQVALFRAGQLFDRPDWCETAHWLCRQELAYQTEEGFWEESPNNGPSMKYNHLMLAPLAWMYRLTADKDIGRAAKKLAKFMARYTFPDGITVGAFDGRQSTSLAWFEPVCPGLELVPEGRTLNARSLRLWREAGCCDDPRLIGNSTWYAYFAGGFLATMYEYFADYVPARERTRAFSTDKPLPVDGQVVLGSRSRTFEGLLQHKKTWVTALSGQYAIRAHRNPSLYNLERQSRIEIWHERARLVIGGGHSRHDLPFPYANAILDTGWCGDTDFGLVDQARDSRRRAYYVPHWTETGMEGDDAHLKLVFAHGTVTWQIKVADDRHIKLQAAWEVRSLKRLALQIPLIVWDGAELSVDGHRQGPEFSRIPAEKTIAVQGGTWKSHVRLTVPEGVPCRVNYPLDILRTYLKLHEHEKHDPWFRMAMVSCQISNPPDGNGSMSFGIELK